MAGAAEGPLEVLRRWESTGAVWRVLDRSGAMVTVGLFTCDGGEQVGSVRTADDRVLAYLGDRTSNTD